MYSIIDNREVHTHWGLIYPVVPMSGWNGKPWKVKHWRIRVLKRFEKKRKEKYEKYKN
jgi:hypothetical protein